MPQQHQRPKTFIIPSQVIFSKPKGVATTDSSNSSANVVFVADTNVSDGNSTEVFADENVSDGNSTGIGLGNSFDTFNTKPEEEIIFEKGEAIVPLHSAQSIRPVILAQCLLGWEKFVLGRWCPVWRHHRDAHYFNIDSRKSSLRWATALIHKLLLTAWDLWQYRNHRLHEWLALVS